MRPSRSVVPALLLISLGSGWAVSRGADPPALSALKEKGLAKLGHTFVIEAEKPVLARMKEVRALLAGHASLVERQAAAEAFAAHLGQLEARRVELQDGINDLNQRINEQGLLQGNNGPPRPGAAGGSQRAVAEMIFRRDQFKEMLADVAQEQKVLKSQSPPARDRKAPDEDVKKQGDAVRAALAELRPMVDGVVGQYADLGADPSVKAAIGELERASKATLRLGPSDAFQAGVKALDQAERKFLGKKPPALPKKKAKARN